MIHKFPERGRPRAGLPAGRSELCETSCFAEGEQLCDRLTCWADKLGAKAARPAARSAAPRPAARRSATLNVLDVYKRRNGGAR